MFPITSTHIQLAPGLVIDLAHLCHAGLCFLRRSATAKNVERLVDKLARFVYFLRPLHIPIACDLTTTNYPKS
jgi:hypothetical protein